MVLYIACIIVVTMTEITLSYQHCYIHNFGIEMGGGGYFKFLAVKTNTHLKVSQAYRYFGFWDYKVATIMNEIALRCIFLRRMGELSCIMMAILKVIFRVEKLS